MFFVKVIGWFILLLPLMVVIYNMPLSLLVSAYSKIRHGVVVEYSKMPGIFVAIAMVATILTAGFLGSLFSVDNEPLFLAALLRVFVYSAIRY